MNLKLGAHLEPQKKSVSAIDAEAWQWLTWGGGGYPKIASAPLTLRGGSG